MGIDETPDFTKLRTEGRVARFPVLDLLRTAAVKFLRQFS